MSVQNGERLATKQDLADMYQGILPYLGGIVTSKAGFTPIGTIISVMGTSAPVNYLACDGTVYNIADYTELANYFNEQFGSKNFFGGNGTTTFAVPDLRGEFLRGTGTNSHENQGKGADVGVHQDATENPWIARYRDAINPDNNLIINSQVAKNDPTKNLQPKNQDSNIPGRLAYHQIKITSSIDDSSQSVSAYTVRPTNTSVLYCIATKNFYIDPTLDYSTDEKVVGTWIDSKPIYQRTFVLNNPSYNWVAIDIGLGNVDSLWKTACYAETSDGTILIEHSFGTTSYFTVMPSVASSTHNTTILIQSKPTYPTKVYITLQYTKTTD